MSSAVEYSPDQLLDFWFEDCRSDPDRARTMNGRWFEGGEALDRRIRQDYAAWIDAAAAGELAAWQESARGRLAIILLLDQFPRNIYRGTSRAFAFDDQALRVAMSLIDRGLFELSPPEQVFALLPLTHSENLADQERALEVFDRCIDSGDERWRAVLSRSREFARDHHNVIARFGRFPHRNAVLGRDNTPEEEAFLAEADSWGQ